MRIENFSTRSPKMDPRVTIRLADSKNLASRWTEEARKPGGTDFLCSNWTGLHFLFICLRPSFELWGFFLFVFQYSSAFFSTRLVWLQFSLFIQLFFNCLLFSLLFSLSLSRFGGILIEAILLVRGSGILARSGFKIWLSLLDYLFRRLRNLGVWLFREELSVCLALISFHSSFTMQIGNSIETKFWRSSVRILGR